MADVMSTLRGAGLLSELDVQVARGLARLCGERSEDAVLAAAVVSRATRAGHVCLELSRAGAFATDEAGEAKATLPSAEAWRDVLVKSALVGDGARGDRPLVLDGDRLYLRRYFTYERRLAEALAKRIGPLEEGIDGAKLREGLDRLFPRLASGERDCQRLAALVAVTRRFCIISGGPGTGKTTTVTKILALLQEQALAVRGRKLHVLLVAPTGKAAQRLRESIEASRASLAVTEDVRALIPSDATTIHRRLAPIPGSTTRFRHKAENPLPCDVLLVDEASMVDLPLMTRLVEALPDAAKLILLGDRNQLASVETGAILGDLCGPAREVGFSRGFAQKLFELVGEEVPVAEGAGGLEDCVVQLEKSYRYGDRSGIGALARAVNAGDGDEAVRLLTSGDHADIALVPFGDGFRRSVVEGYRGFVAERTADGATAALNRYRVLCAHRRGELGVETLNPAIEAALVESAGLRAGRDWYDHRPVLVVENDYAVNLFNGDVGVALRDELTRELRVHFGERELAPSRLPRHDTVFAMTVHKAQGSEFDEVAFVLPEKGSKVLTRELVYTGVTRARTRVVTFGTVDTVMDAVATAVERASGLRSRHAIRESR